MNETNLFELDKLFLNLNVELLTTGRTLSFYGITLNNNVIRKFNLKYIKLTFLKNEHNLSEGSNRNNNFDPKIVTVNDKPLQISLSNDNKALVDNFDSTRILNYTPVQGDYLEFIHEYDGTDIDTEFYDSFGPKKLYNLNFDSRNALVESDETIWAQLRNYYSSNPEETFSCILTAYDEENNVIDVSDIIKLDGFTWNTLIESEFKELINLFKSEVLSESVSLEVLEDRFLVNNFLGDRTEDTEFRRFDPNYAYINNLYSLVDRDKVCKAYNSYPALEAAWVYFVLSEDIRDNDSSYLSPWIFSNEINNPSENLFLNSSQIQNFLISASRTRGPVLQYYSPNIPEPISISLDNATRSLDNGDEYSTWQYEKVVRNIGQITDFEQAILNDYTNNVTEFKFSVITNYTMRGYTKSKKEEFSLSNEFYIQRSNISNLVENIIKKSFRSEIQRAFSFVASLESRGLNEEKDVLKLTVTIENQNLIQQSVFFNSDSEDRPFLKSIKQIVSPNRLENSPNATDSLSRNSNFGDILNETVYIDESIYLEDLSGEWYFKLLNKQTYTREIFGELIFEINTTYNGIEIEVRIPVDIPFGAFLNQERYYTDLNDSYNLLLVQNDQVTNSDIFFENLNRQTTWPGIIRFSFDKTKADAVSGLLNFGNTALESSNDDPFSKLFLENIVFEIGDVFHDITINYVWGEKTKFRIVKSNKGLKNRYFNQQDFESTENSYSTDLELDFLLGINDRDIQDIALDSNKSPSDKSIVQSFLSKNWQNFTNITNHSYVKSIDYKISCSHKIFLFPNGLNLKSVRLGGVDLSGVTYDNVQDKISAVTDDVIEGLYNVVYESRSSDGPATIKNIVLKWLTRNVQDIDTKNSRYKFVKDYLARRNYSEIELPGLSEDDLKKIRENSIANNVIKNLNYGEYDANWFNNIDNCKVSLNYISPGFMKEYLSYAPRIIVGSANTFNTDNTSVEYSKIEIYADNSSDLSFELKCLSLLSNSNLPWDLRHISRVSATFMPRLLNIIIDHEKINDITSVSLGSNTPIASFSNNNLTIQQNADQTYRNELINIIRIGPDNGLDQNINIKYPYFNGTFSISGTNNDTLRVNFPIRPSTLLPGRPRDNGFNALNLSNYDDFGKYFINSGERTFIKTSLTSENLWREQYDRAYYIDRTGTRLADQHSTTIRTGPKITPQFSSNPSIDEEDQTIFIKDFIYRIKIELTNGKTLYSNYRIPLKSNIEQNFVIMTPAQNPALPRRKQYVNLMDRINNDPIRKSVIDKYNDTYNKSISYDYEGFYNLSCFPYYKEITAQSFHPDRLKNSYTGCYLSNNIPGYPGYSTPSEADIRTGQTSTARRATGSGLNLGSGLSISY